MYKRYNVFLLHYTTTKNICNLALENYVLHLDSEFNFDRQISRKTTITLYNPNSLHNMPNHLIIYYHRIHVNNHAGIVR